MEQARLPLAPDVLDLHPTHAGARYTLRGVYSDHEKGRQVARDWLAKGYIVNAFIETSPLGNELLFVATRHSGLQRPRAGIPHQTDVRWDATRMAVAAFRHVMRRSKAKGYGARWYKDLEEEKMHDLVGSYSWAGEVREVAAGILSATIVKHPFPNANHRTSIALMRLFLKANGLEWPHYSLRGRGDRRLHREAEPFFRES